MYWLARLDCDPEVASQAGVQTPPEPPDSIEQEMVYTVWYWFVQEAGLESKFKEKEI